MLTGFGLFMAFASSFVSGAPGWSRGSRSQKAKRPIEDRWAEKEDKESKRPTTGQPKTDTWWSDTSWSDSWRSNTWWSAGHSCQREGSSDAKTEHWRPPTTTASQSRPDERTPIGKKLFEGHVASFQPHGEPEWDEEPGRKGGKGAIRYVVVSNGKSIPISLRFWSKDQVFKAGQPVSFNAAPDKQEPDFGDDVAINVASLPGTGWHVSS
jgi:hypothetical protein